MRLDQFLQKTGIVKRRTLAKEFCDHGAVELNGRKVKPAQDVSPGDKLSVRFRDRRVTYQVLIIPSGNVSKAARSQLVSLISEDHFHEDKHF